MIQVRKSSERGHAQHGWLDSRHTFSFADYQDPRFMGFRTLRVINEDQVQPGRGFGTHSHRDMEIVSWVLSGALEHRDSMGNGSVIRPGDIQMMRAGTGVTHSEFNPSADEAVRFLQIWILPDAAGLPPAYEQQHVPASERDGRLRVIAAREPHSNAVQIHQDVTLYAAQLRDGATLRHALAPKRHAWLQLTSGSLSLNGVSLDAGDGAAISDEAALEIVGRSTAELLLFDLA